MSGSSYCPRSAVYVHGTAPRDRIHATATEVSRPPEKAMPMRSPLGREVRTLLTRSVLLGQSSRSQFTQTRDELGAGEGLAGHHQEGVVAGDRADHVVQGGPVQGARQVVRPARRGA